MATIRKLTHAAVLITTDDQATLIDPGVHTLVAVVLAAGMLLVALVLFAKSSPGEKT
jgi:L-ascorbate metabolism protein UlaG (beta-lactamase superfamily)